MSDYASSSAAKTAAIELLREAIDFIHDGKLGAAEGSAMSGYATIRDAARLADEEHEATFCKCEGCGEQDDLDDGCLCPYCAALAQGHELKRRAGMARIKGFWTYIGRVAS